MKKNKFQTKTSWHKVGDWYNDLVGEQGHYYHQHLILPGVLRLLDLKKIDNLLDLGCGQGILGKKIPKEVYYQGVDNAKSLIELAKNNEKNQLHHYLTADICKPIPIAKKDFTHVALILTLQNIEFPQEAIKNASLHSRNKGKLIIVLNHPCFRIPRQSGWQISSENKNQFRWISRYLTPLKIPITTHPGKKHSPITWSFHHPLSTYTNYLSTNGYLIETIEEWISDKKSLGNASKMENRARNEIPLFLTILARKER